MSNQYLNYLMTRSDHQYITDDSRPLKLSPNHHLQSTLSSINLPLLTVIQSNCTCVLPTTDSPAPPFRYRAQNHQVTC